MSAAELVFDPETLDLAPLLKRLHLANARRVWLELCSRAEEESWTPRRLLATLFAEEIAHRRQTRLQRQLRRANFPFFATVEDFDFTMQSTLRMALLGSYLGPELVSEGRNLVLQGKTGRGKTHLAVGIAYRAIQNGFTAYCETAAELIDKLSRAGRDGRFEEALAGYVQPHVLLIDELGYLTYGTDAANVLFHVVNERHRRRRPMLFTTNKSPLTQWGTALHDADLAEAIADRVLERGRLILMDGPSYRTRHLTRAPARKAGTDEPVRISGKNRSEFPEPAGRPPRLPWSGE